MNQQTYLSNLREKALRRPRRVIFDNDGGDATSLCPGLTAEDLLGVRAKPALATGVDTYIYTTGWGFGMGLHDSKVGSVLRSREGHLARNLAEHFLRDNTDCLRIQSEYIKSEGREFFWGMRMNDTHDHGYGGVFLPDNQFKRQHPEVLLGEQLKYGAATAVDYLDPAVRDFALAYILDVVDRYDIDGIFLDFFRHPIFFRSNAQGHPASAEEITAMNDFLRALHANLNTRRLAAEKYHLVAVRVPDSVEYCRAIGLDLETWLSEGFADMLVTAGYFQLNEWEYSAQLGHKHNIPVFPSLDESRVKSELARHKRNCTKGFYGRVMNAWNSGCDGICIFNNSGLSDVRENIPSDWFAEEAGNFQEALSALSGDNGARLERFNKRYFASFRGVGRVPCGALPHEDYIRICTLNHLAPIQVFPETSVDVPLRVPEDFSPVSRPGSNPIVTASIFLRGNPASISICLNGEKMGVTIFPAPVEENEAPEYLLKVELAPTLVKRGCNVFTFTTEGVLLTLLDLWVDVDSV